MTSLCRQPLPWRNSLFPLACYNACWLTITSVTIMFASIRTEGRLLGFDSGDWSILTAGLALVGLLIFLI